MKILLAVMQHNYGDPSREYSYEHFNFYLALKQMGHEVALFDYALEIKKFGKTGMNQKLLERVQEWQPTLAFFSLYTDQFEESIIDQLRRHTKTICFFHDDTWRVDYSRHWAQHFDFFTTPDIYGKLKYDEIGLTHSIHFPFGCNEQIYKKINAEKKYDVSFIGAYHPYRAWLIHRLQKEGIQVQVAGQGWPNGEINHEGMVQLFNESRINLNLSNSASWDMRYLLSSPRALINRIRSKKNIEQLKARIFEINSCGSFQLSYYVAGLESYYKINQEIAIYTDPDDLIEKVQFYLKYENLRESIAEAGLKRTLSEHTMTERFENVFHKMGLINSSSSIIT